MHIIKKYKYIYDANFRNLPIEKRLTIGLHLLRRYVFRLKFPISIMVGLTYRCQCKCAHCCVGEYPVLQEQELTSDEVFHLIDEAISLGVCKVRFFGGEPLIREDIFSLTKYASQKGLIVSMDTNGLLLNKEVAQKLRKSGMCEVDVSIDSCRPEFHDRLRMKEGSYELAITAAKNCINEGISVLFSTYMTRETIARYDLAGIIKLGRELGVTGIKVLFPVAAGRWFNNTEIILTDDEKRHISRFLDSSFVFFEGQGNNDCKSCSMLKREIFYVSPYADVQACCFVPLFFGNVRKEKLKNIWERMSKSPLYGEGYSPCVMNDKKFREKYFTSNQAEMSIQHGCQCS